MQTPKKEVTTGDIVYLKGKRYVVTSFFGQRRKLHNGEMQEVDYVGLQSACERRYNVSVPTYALEN
jgi:hypothetical protein